MPLASPKQHFTSYFASKMTSYEQEILRIYRVSESPSKNEKNGGRGLQDCLLGAFWGVQKITFYARMAPKKYENITLKKASIKPLEMSFLASSSRKTLVFDPLQKCPKYGIGFKRELDVVPKRTFRLNLR